MATPRRLLALDVSLDTDTRAGTPERGTEANILVEETTGIEEAKSKLEETAYDILIVSDRIEPSTIDALANVLQQQHSPVPVVIHQSEKFELGPQRETILTDGWKLVPTDTSAVTYTKEDQTALLAALFKALPVGVIAETPDREIMAVNQAFIDLFELEVSAAELVGKDCRDLAETASDLFTFPDRFATRIDTILEAGTPIEHERLTLADGRQLARSYRPIDLDDGRGHCWVYRDITEQASIEATLRSFQQQLHQLHRTRTPAETAEAAVELATETLSMPFVGVHLLDETKEVLEPVAVSDEVTAAVSPLPQYKRGEGATPIDAMIWEVFESGTERCIEDIANDESIDASTMTVKAVLIYPVGDHGVIIASTTEPTAFSEYERHLLDILATHVTTVLERNEHLASVSEQAEQLQAQNRQLEDFAKILSHDLRNPLTVAQGHLDLALEEVDSEDLEIARDAVDRMTELIDKLRTLTREGNDIEESTPVALAEVINECWATTHTQTATLEIENDVTIEADDSRLRQLLENLLRNAVEHGGDDVTIRCGPLEDGFYLEDDGPGIPTEDRERIFETGFSSESTNTGFGLAIVESIATAHGWDITVAESNEGGARFEVRGVSIIEDS